MIPRSALAFSDGAAGPVVSRADDLSWRDLGECQYTDPELWFPEKGGSVRDAKRICKTCAVEAECLEYALETGQRFGIWGATSEVERRRILRDRNPDAAPALCRAGLHAMDGLNILAFGDCRKCRKARDAAQGQPGRKAA